MFENECATNEFMIHYLELLVADLQDDDMDRIACDDFNPPRWILGHLAVYTDYALRVLGGRFCCSKDWHRSFTRGSEAGSVPEDRPGKAELVERICEGFAEVRKLTGTADQTVLQKEHAVPFLKGTALVSNAHVLSHLLTTHFAAHLGQLSAWRRIMGRTRVEPGTPAA